MRLSILFFLVLSFKSFSFTPQDFSLPPSVGGSAIFVDFLTANYDLIYDVAKKKATYKAIITFDQKSYGKPIFDVVNKPTAIKLNNDFVRDIEISSPYN